MKFKTTIVPHTREVFDGQLSIEHEENEAVKVVSADKVGAELHISYLVISRSPVADSAKQREHSHYANH